MNSAMPLCSYSKWPIRWFWIVVWAVIHFPNITASCLPAIPERTDPDWRSRWAYSKKVWAEREKAVYEYEMDRKVQDNRGWSYATYYQADEANKRIDRLLAKKWD